MRRALLKPLKLSLLLAAFATQAPARAQVIQTASLADFSLEQLGELVVTSVTRQEESLLSAEASIYVIRAEEIRRSGAVTLPEALRLAPNLQVARVDARNYAISARGLNNVFANKLQVLIDGRTIYTPLFAGVFWDVPDVMMEDIDRIEVISGAGGTMWGANAVNGVINIITRAAKDTEGSLASAGASRFQHSAALRHGGALDNGGHYRVYGKYLDDDNTRQERGRPNFTGWRRSQGGFRADWDSYGKAMTVQGDAYQGYLQQAGTADIRVAGANLLGRATRRLDDGSSLRLQAYLDHTEREQPNAYRDYLDTLDLELNRTVKLAGRHQVIFGGGYRQSWDRIDNDRAFAFLPDSKKLRWANLFAQDEIALRRNLSLTLGLKLENNTYTGTEYLPNVKLAWNPDDTKLVWAGASRAVRVPSRIDRDFFVPTSPVLQNGVPQYVYNGGPDVVAEVAKVFELGYRAQPSSRLSYSATLFYTDYDRLRNLEPNAQGPGMVFANKGQGAVRGIELWGSWRPTEHWRLAAGFVAQRVELRLRPGSVDLTTNLTSNDPSAYWNLRVSHDLSATQQIDAVLRHVGALPSPYVPSYTELDLRYAWKLRPDLELSVVGQNLLHATHREFGAPATGSVVERTVFFKGLWSF